MRFMVRLTDGNERPVEAESYRLDEATRRYVFIAADKTEDQFLHESEVKSILREGLPTPLSERGQEVALSHFNHVESQVMLAATTAGLVVAADALIINAYLRVVYEYKVFKTFGISLEGGLFGLAGVLIVIAFVCALFAVFPNVRFYAFQNTVENVVFFGWIGKQEFPDYLKVFTDKDAGGDLDRELLYQVWGKSQWLTKMFKALQLAVLLTIAGTALAASVLLICGYRLPVQA